MPGVSAGCIMIHQEMGATTPWTGSARTTLDVFADDDSPQVFTTESIYVVIGYTFKRLGNKVLADGSTPAEVVFSHPNGTAIEFTFREGESFG